MVDGRMEHSDTSGPYTWTVAGLEPGPHLFQAIAIDGARARVDARATTINVAFIRFCWIDSPVCNLYNEADFPAVPFEVAVPASR